MAEGGTDREASGGSDLTVKRTKGGSSGRFGVAGRPLLLIGVKFSSVTYYSLWVKQSRWCRVVSLLRSGRTKLRGSRGNFVSDFAELIEAEYRLKE
jgi:hypothetical protein